MAVTLCWTKILSLMLGVAWIVAAGLRRPPMTESGNDKYKMNHRCLRKIGDSFEIMFDGMLCCVADLVTFWKWTDVGIVLIGSDGEETTRDSRPAALLQDGDVISKEGPKWNSNVVHRLFQARVETVSTVSIRAFEDEAHIVKAMQNFDVTLRYFVLLSWTEQPLVHFMNVLNVNRMVANRQIWILGVQNHALSIAGMKRLVANQTQARKAQFAVLSPSNGSNDTQDGCKNVRMFDVFFSAGSGSTVEAIQFGEWIHPRGLYMLEELSAKESVLRLRQRLVRGLVFEYEPYAFLKTNKHGQFIYGYVPDIVRILAQNLNFKFEVQVSNETAAGTKVGNTRNYTGTIGAMYTQETDIAANVLSITAQRWDAVSFSFTIFYGAMGLWLQAPGKFVSPIAHVQAFSDDVWILTAAFTIALIALLTVSRVFHPSFDAGTDGGRRPMLNWILQGDFLTTMLDTANSTSSKLFMGTLLLFALLLFTHYCSMFMAFLTNSISAIPFNTERELVTAHAYKVTMIGNANYYDMLKSSKSGVLRDLWKKVVRDKEPTAKNALMGLQSLCTSSQRVFLIDSRAAAYLAQTVECTVTVIKTNQLKEFGHITIRKEFPFNRIIYRTLLRIKEYGLMSRLREIYFNIDFLKPDTNSEVLSLNLNHFIIPFMVLNLGIIASVFVTLLEIAAGLAVNRRRNRNGSTK